MKELFILPQEIKITNSYIPFKSISKNLTKPYEIYEINQEKEQILVTKSGSVIKIPARSLENLDGSLFTGKADIYYREIRTAADIIGNGLNMEILVNGKSEFLKTAGMFEIRAFKDKSPLKIRNGKNIKVEYISESKEIYDNYVYNEKTKNWEKTSEIDNHQTEIVPLYQPVKQQKTDLTIKAKIDFSQIPQLSDYENIVWKYTGTGDINKIRKDLEQNFHNQTIKIITENPLTLKYSLSSQTSLKTSKLELELFLQPIFAEQDYHNALEKYNKRNLLITEIKTKRKNLLTEQNIMNSFNISRFAVYNCDVIGGINIFINANFKFNNPKIDISNIQIYCISGDNDNMIMNFNSGTERFNFMPNTKNKVVGISPEAVGVISSNDFRNLNLEQKFRVGMNNNSKFDFTLTQVSNNIDNLEQLNKLISSL